MNLVPSYSTKRAIAVLVVMAASVVPFYSQEPAPTTPSIVESAAVSAPPEVPSEIQNNQQTGTAQTDPQQAPKRTFVFPTRRERFDRYVKSTVGPFSLFNSALVAGINQWRDTPDEWEQGMSGYGKRYASSFGRNAIQHTVTYGLDSALGLDTGFRKSERTKFVDRLKDALAENVTSRTRSGKRVISVPRFAGVYTSTIIASEAWYPERYSYKDGLRAGTGAMLTGFGLNLIREFLINW